MDVDTYYALQKIEAIITEEAEQNLKFRQTVLEFMEDMHTVMLEGEEKETEFEDDIDEEEDETTEGKTKVTPKKE